MAIFTIINNSSGPVFLADLYVSLEAGASMQFTRSLPDLAAMSNLQKLLVSADIAFVGSPTFTADDLSVSGLEGAPASIEVGDLKPVALGDGVFGPCFVLTKTFAAGIGGAADDVTVIAAALAALPVKCEVVAAYYGVTAGMAPGVTVGVRTRAAGAGTLLSTLDCSVAAGVAAGSGNAATPALTEGLYLRRSANTVAGFVTLVLRPVL